MIESHFISLINAIANRVTNLIKRCVLTRVSKDDAQYQIGQCQYLGRVADIEFASLYGHSYNAPLDSTGIMVNILGDEENQAAFFNLPQERFKNLKSGEVQCGNFVTRSSIKFAEDGEIIIDSKGNIEIISEKDLSITVKGNSNIKTTGSATIESDSAVTIKAPQITLDGTVIITGTLDVEGVVTGSGINLSTHIHSGVTTGTENTGIPVS